MSTSTTSRTYREKNEEKKTVNSKLIFIWNMKKHWKKRQLDTKKIRINKGYQMQEMEGAVTYDNDNRSENKNVLKNNFWHKCTHTNGLQEQLRIN